jgi:hypothetical protein
MNHSSALVK